MRSFNRRIIFAEDVVATTPWQPHHLTGPGGRAGPDHSDAEQAPLPGYEDGLREGQRLGAEHARLEYAQQRQQELAQLGQTLHAVTQSYTEQLARLQQQLADDVLTLACAVARSVVTSALRVQPTLIGPAIQTALQALIDDKAPVTVRLHPDDLAALHDALLPDIGERSVRWIADATLRQGGCMVETRHSVVDARIQTRWQQATAALGLTDTWIEPAP